MTRYQFYFVMAALLMNVAASADERVFSLIFSFIAAFYIGMGMFCKDQHVGEEP